MTEPFSYEPHPTAWEIEHADPMDRAESLVELLEVRVAEAREMCDLHPDQPRPCPCEVPFSQREMKSWKARADEGPMRYRGIG